MAKSKRVDEVAASVFGGDEPVEAPPLMHAPQAQPVAPTTSEIVKTADIAASCANADDQREAWLQEAHDVRTVLLAGNAVSPDTIKTLLLRAIPLVARS